MPIEERRLHNASTLISRLPNELLISVFFTVVEDLWDDYSFSERAAYVGAENLREVCFLWSDLVSAIPSIWAFAADSWPRRKVLRAIALSLDKPITIESKRDDTSTISDFINLLLPHAWRWKVATIDMPLDQTESDIYRHLYMPHLQELCIENQKGWSEFPLEFEKSRLPALRSLSLVEKSVSWDSPVITGLDFLGIWLRGSVDLSAQDFLAIFERNPALTELYHTSSSIVSHSPIKAIASLNDQIITMQQLHSLELDVVYNIAHLVFECVGFPALKKGKLRLWDVELNLPFATKSLTETFNLIISRLFPDTFDIWYHKSIATLAFQNPSREFTMDLRFAFDDGEAEVVKELRNLLHDHKSRIRRSSITTSSCTLEEWEKIDSALAFQEIALNDWGSSDEDSPAAAGFLSALSPLYPQAGHKDAERNFLFPQLDTIRICYFSNISDLAISNLKEVFRPRYASSSTLSEQTTPEQPTRLKVLDLLSGTRPSDGVFAGLDRILGVGTTRWNEKPIYIEYIDFSE